MHPCGESENDNGFAETRDLADSRNYYHRAESSPLIASLLSELCSLTHATAGIAWRKIEDAQLLWMAGHRIDATDAGVDSEFMRDVLLNAYDVFETGRPDGFAPLDEHATVLGPRFLASQDPTDGESVESDQMRELVLGCQQILVPVSRSQEAYLFHLFVSGSHSREQLMGLVGRVHRQVQQYL